VVYDVTDGSAKYFPLQNYSPLIHNPDGDIQFQFGLLFNQSGTQAFLAFVDPNLTDLPSMNVVHGDVQGAFTFGPITMDSIREYSELAAVGWNIDYTTLSDQFHTPSPLETWYRTCFDATGVFTPSQNPHCKFSVHPQDLEFLQ
jgi:hypothetical protein